MSHKILAIECKTRKVLPEWLEEGLEQAEASAKVEWEGKGVELVPVVFVHKDHSNHNKDWVVMRYVDFKKHFHRFYGFELTTTPTLEEQWFNVFARTGHEEGSGGA